MAQNIPFHLISSHGKYLHSLTLPKNAKIWIYPIGTIVKIKPGKKGAKWYCETLIPSMVEEAAKKRTNIKASSPSFDSKKDVEAHHTLMEKQRLEEIKLTHTKGGIEVTIDWLMSLPETQLKRYIRVCQNPLRSDFSEPSNLPLDPRFLGIWLAEGTAQNSNITSADPEVVKYIKEYAQSFDLKYVAKEKEITYNISNQGRVTGRSPKKADQCGKFVSWIKTHNPEKDTFMKVGRKTRLRWAEQLKELGEKNFLKINHIFWALKTLNLINNKHIPEIYLKASRQDRIALLEGLIAGDGYKHKHGYEIAQKSEAISKGIQTLAQSLGFFITSTPKLAIATNARNHQGTWVTRMLIFGIRLHEVKPMMVRKYLSENLQSESHYYAKVIFGSKPEETKKRKIDWNAEIDKTIQLLYKKHGNKFAKIAQDEAIVAKGLKRADIRNRLSSLNVLQKKAESKS